MGSSPVLSFDLTWCDDELLLGLVGVLTGHLGVGTPQSIGFPMSQMPPPLSCAYECILLQHRRCLFHVASSLLMDPSEDCDRFFHGDHHPDCFENRDDVSTAIGFPILNRCDH